MVRLVEPMTFPPIPPSKRYTVMIQFVLSALVWRTLKANPWIQYLVGLKVWPVGGLPVGDTSVPLGVPHCWSTFVRASVVGTLVAGRSIAIQRRDARTKMNGLDLQISIPSRQRSARTRDLRIYKMGLEGW